MLPVIPDRVSLSLHMLVSRLYIVPKRSSSLRCLSRRCCCRRPSSAKSRIATLCEASSTRRLQPDGPSVL